MIHRKASEIKESTDKSYHKAESLSLDIRNIQNKIDGKT